MNEITLFERQEQATAVIRERVPMNELPQFFARAYQATMAAAQAQGRHPTGPPFSMYHGRPTDVVDVEAGFPVNGAIAPADGVVPGTLPAGKVVQTTHVGPYDTLSQTYDMVLGYMKEHDLTPADDMWEVYLSDPQRQPDPATWRTEIFWPVAD